GTVCVVGKIRDLILQLSKSSIYSTKPFRNNLLWHGGESITDQAFVKMRRDEAVLRELQQYKIARRG
ncbi:hypothetical protein C9161_20900, partial [Escherichia coli]